MGAQKWTTLTELGTTQLVARRASGFQWSVQRMIVISPSIPRMETCVSRTWDYHGLSMFIHKMWVPVIIKWSFLTKELNIPESIGSLVKEQVASRIPCWFWFQDFRLPIALGAGIDCVLIGWDIDHGAWQMRKLSSLNQLDSEVKCLSWLRCACVGIAAYQSDLRKEMVVAQVWWQWNALPGWE